MIYTVTFNPSLDYTVTVDDFLLGKTNRTASEQMTPGGKGINVSAVLRNLGVETKLLGFTAGFVGEEIRRRLEEAGLDCDFIHLEKGCSRINVKLKNYDGTEINGRGPEAGEEEFNRLLGQLDSLEAGDGLVLAGSLAAGLPADTYGRILDRIAGRGILTAVDTAGRSLLEALKGRPFLIKPNRDELEELFEERADEPERLAALAGRLQDMGARNVLVSLGGDGAFLLDEEKMGHRLGAPKGRLENSVGAGDSMVAGFLAGWLEKGSYSHAFAMGVAAGSASAFLPGLAGREAVQSVYGRLEKESLFPVGS